MESKSPSTLPEARMALREVMNTFYAVNAVRKIQNIKPSTAKVYQYTFFHKQSIFDPHPENCLSFSKKLPQKIV